MTTSLGAQLAQFRANTTNALDLKAQKKAHARSLLFDPRDAATQDFDTIYQLCYDGFQELCRLDSRFISFASNIFSEQSKDEDRTQMTGAQSNHLDSVLEEFLGLVGGKLLLKPAVKAVEWLVRRFRVHENNTVCLVLTFLPYHDAPIFPTMLSILPRNIPPTLKFLHPYIQSLANLPRHTIVYTATHNKSFFVAMNAYVLGVTRRGHHHATLLSFWATVTTEAVAGILDHSRSGRREAQKQLQEDVILRILPVLYDGLSLRDVPDLRVGCYMILTVLASKASLGDEALTTMMEAVATAWKGTTHAGLICLAVLAQQRQAVALPSRVLKALLAIEKLDDDLMTLRKRYKVDKLVLGVLLGIVRGLGEAPDADRLRTFRILIEAGLIHDSSVAIAIRSLFSAAESVTLESRPELDVRGLLGDLILRLTDSTAVGHVVQDVVKESGVDMENLESQLQSVIRTDGDITDLATTDIEMHDADELPAAEAFDVAVSRIPIRTAYEISFLSHSNSFVFASLAHAFLLASSSPADLKSFSDLAVLRKSLAMTEPFFLSFYIRIWCGNYPATARSAALNAVTEYFRCEKLLTDVQVLLPYIVHAMADPSSRVRRAGGDLALVLSGDYGQSTGSERKRLNRTILGQEQIYGQQKDAEEITWLSNDEAARFVQDLIVPSLEECMLDAGHVISRLADTLIRPVHAKGSKHIHKELKTSLRLAIFTFLCSHVANTPLYAVKNRLLPMLNRVQKIGSTSSTKALLPVLIKTISQTKTEFEEICRQEQLDPRQLINRIIGIITPFDRDGLHNLQAIIGSANKSTSALLTATAFQHLEGIWSSTKSEGKALLAETLLELAIEIPEDGNANTRQSEAMDTLRKLELSTIILQSFLEDLPVLSLNSPESPSAPKRRRTNQSSTTLPVVSDPKIFTNKLRKITFVLELIEASKAERHPQLLKGLFQVLADLQRSKSDAGTELGYLQVLAMSNMLTIVKNIETSTRQRLDRPAIQASVLIDCVRTTGSPQVQHIALLLVSSLASIAPELILHSVMPIFTFMGANILRQNDEYSAYVVEQTMESVIPRLVQSLYKQKGEFISGVSELILSFVAAFEHIPSRRRLDLFVSLADKLGVNESLFALFILLIDKYPSDKTVVQFATELAGRHTVEAQFCTAEKYLDVILDTFEPKPTLSAHLLILDKYRTAESVIANLLPLLSKILRAERFVSKTSMILGQEEGSATLIRAFYTRLVEQIFLLSKKTKENGRLVTLCNQVLDALLRLLSISEFVETLQGLLDRADNEIHRQVLSSFEQRLNARQYDQTAAQTACLAFLPRLTSILEKSSDPQLKHTAIASMDRIVEKFGKKDTAAVIAVASTISGDKCLGSNDSSLRVTALLCLATMLEILGDRFVPVIPHTFSKAMEHLSTSIQDNIEDKRLHNACYSFVSALLLHVPWMVTGAYLEHWLRLSHESANAEMGEECDLNRIVALRLVAKQIEPKECFAALQKTWPSAMTEGPIAVKEYLEVLRIAIERQPKSLIVQQSETLEGLFLKAFDLRRIQLSPRTEDSYEDDEIEVLEAAVNVTAIAMIYKLNDTTFRPLFTRVHDWATISSPNKDKKSRLHRQITWYTFLIKFFDTLKSIVTSYAGLILEDTVEVLNSVSPKDEESRLLWQRVIQMLNKAFEHDQDDFWQSPSHFASISGPLVSQLSHAAHMPMVPGIIPAITELAVAADSANHHKEINAAVLKHMRSDSPAVRLAAVQCEQSLTNRLGEEWLALLPEMLPFISELQEDDDEAVERETQSWIRSIEGILGESLSPMLQ